MLDLCHEDGISLAIFYCQTTKQSWDKLGRIAQGNCTYMAWFNKGQIAQILGKTGFSWGAALGLKLP